MMAGPCNICVQKSEEIRDILEPFGLHHVQPVGGVKILAARYIALQAELAEARKDTARIDWRESQVPEGFQWAVGKLDSGHVTIHPIRRGYDLDGHYTLHETYREACDAARALPEAGK